jgi:RNA polymerase sigma-70 factor, ECF subfamily
VTEDIRKRMVDFLPRLRRFACSLTKDLDHGDDLVQETCTRALQRIDQWEPGTSLESWMFRIAQNIWFDRNRAAKTRGPAVDVDDMLQLTGEDGRSVTEHSLVLKSVLEGMSRLPPEQQVLISLVCIEGLSYKEAAHTLNVPIGTVMSRLARARRALHDSLEGTPVSNVVPLQVRSGHARIQR